jgi:putative membrane protein
MYVRRSLLSLAVISVVTSGCFLLRPIDPSGMSSPKESEQPQDTTPSQPAEAAPVPSEPVATTPAPVIPAPVPTVTPTPTPTDTAPAAPVSPVMPVAEPTPAPRVEPVTPAPAARRTEIGPVNDATISAMVLASNYTDISYAQLVPARAQRADVRDFAHRMLTDHTTVNQLVRDVLAKLDLAPRDNIASLDMRDESAENRDVLRELSGYAFDSAYVENEVRYHQKFLASLDDIMIPRARHDELQTLLRNVRPAVAAHLAHAEQLRANVLAKK